MDGLGLTALTLTGNGSVVGLDLLLMVSFLTVVVTLGGLNLRITAWLATASYGVQLYLLWGLSPALLDGAVAESVYRFNVLGHSMGWRYDALSAFFALITLIAALAAGVYASGGWGRGFQKAGGAPGLVHLALAANLFAMLVLLGSADFLSLFIGWEMVSWASFVMMVLARPADRDGALKYITYATAGAMALLAALVVINHHAGGLGYAAFAAAVPGLSATTLALLVFLVGVAFGIKMAVLPFHLWQARAYAETPGPGTAFLGAISARMGLYALAVVLVQLIGLTRVADLNVFGEVLDARDLIAWVAVFTIILPTYTALKQNDARYLLAWHGIGQGGYMLLGLVTGTAVGSAGGLLHVFNYAMCQAVLLLAVFSVVHRTGTADLNRLGGLVARMPLSFLALLFGIIGLAGLPPMNGFVSKWMVYVTLVREGEPLLFIGTVVGTLGTILSVFKLIHNMFLGSLRLEHESVSEAPWTMVLPMMVLSGIILATGIMPGLVLDWVAAAQATLGLPMVQYELGGPEGLDMLWVGAALLYGIGVGALLFMLGGRSHRVNPLDNYAGGHFLTAANRYHYSDNFYAGLMHLIGGWYRHTFARLESGLVAFVNWLGAGAHGFFRSMPPLLAMVVVAALVAAWWAEGGVGR
ncbi:MAG: proton-conducting transporter membrane subunit [Gammaproteobacteria bacterium]